MSTHGANKKSVTFVLEKNTTHICTVMYPKGPHKPQPADSRVPPSVPVDLEEKAIIKKYLENEDEQYKGYVLLQYRNNQDESYLLRFLDPNTGERFDQTFMKERIDEILQANNNAHKLK